MAEDENTRAPGARIGSDLWPRVASGVVLAGAAVALTIAGVLPFATLALAVCCIMAWEWGRIVRDVAADAVMVVHVAAMTAGVVLAVVGYVALALLAVAIGMILVALLSFGRHGILSALGVAFTGLPGIALVWFRADEPLGMWAVLFIMGVVAATDTAAYFCGRLIGGPKLWPAVSPNKTWAGLIGAIIASAVAGGLFASALAGGKPERLALAGAVLAVVAQAGDLAESALKRRFATKDASGLIPGHGGFLDRVDGLATAAVAAAVLAALVNILAPARALLFG